jgi:hypothetical protein
MPNPRIQRRLRIWTTAEDNVDGIAGNQNSYSDYQHPNLFYSGSVGPEDFKVSVLNK